MKPLVLLRGGPKAGAVVVAAGLRPLIMNGTPRGVRAGDALSKMPVALWDKRKRWYWVEK